jgi:cbb3-type cytochrome oxidase cytochrome c subunit
MVDGKPRVVPLMQTISRGQKLFKDLACYGCHKIDGFSKGNIGPELTYEGRLAVPQTVEHQLWDPRYKVGSCVMPYFFSVRQRNTDLPDEESRNRLVDARARHTMKLGPDDRWALGVSKLAPTVTPADLESDIQETVANHGYIADASKRDDVDALVTFVSAQTGLNYSEGQADRIAIVSDYNKLAPPAVPVTLKEGKRLFETSGCPACHYIRTKNLAGDPMTLPTDAGKGGIAGPELTSIGSRHSLEWLVKHYENPQAFVPGSIMPIFPFSDSQRKALALYDQSLLGFNPAAKPVSARQDMPSEFLRKSGALTPEIRYMER